MKKRSNREAAFRNELKKSYEFVNFLPFVIYDHAFGPGTSFQRNRPFDMFVVYPDGTMFLELKVSTIPRFPLSRIAEHQIKNLDQIRQLGGEAYIVVNFRNAKEKMNRTFQVPIEQISLYLAQDKKSVTVKELEQNSHVTEFSRKRYETFYGWEVHSE